MASDIHRDEHRILSARDQLFSGVLHELKGLDAFSRPADPSLFIVYAHDNPTAGCAAHASSVKCLIEWLKSINAKLLSDKSPLPSWEIREQEGGDQAAHNIVSNQLCLLPHNSQSTSAVGSVDKVVVCGSPLLRKYYHDSFTADYLEAVEKAYVSTNVGQTKIRDLVQTKCKNTGFHHVLTELAFLRLRYGKKPGTHGIIPLSLGSVEMEYLPLEHADLRLMFDNDSDSLHLLFFKLLLRIYPNQFQLIDKFRGCFQSGYDRLLRETELTEDKVARTISNEITKTHISYQTQMQATLRNSRWDLPDKAPPSPEQTANNQCLTDLRITDPRHDKIRIQEMKGGLLEESYIWVLDDPTFNQWHNDEDQRLLWVKGEPGKGKTMLLCGIIDQLEKSSTRTGLLSYFFCQATDTRLNTATAVLRGLIYGLLDQDISLVSYVKKKYDNAGKALFEDSNAWQATSEILKDIIQGTTFRKAYLVIDALDECRNGLHDLLDLITETSRSTQVKWLVSSRNEPDIEGQLNDMAQRLSLELNAKSISMAVESYISHKVSHIARLKRYPANTTNTIREYLISNANGTFLWVALVCQELTKNSNRFNALQKVKSFPPGLDALYERMMKQIGESEDAKLCAEVLALIATTYRPLSFAESTTLIESGGSTVEDHESLEEVVKLCGSFLTVRGSTIYFVHQSAKDFLTRKRSAIFSSHSEQAIHGKIFSRSVKAMFNRLKRDICQLGHPGFHIEDVTPTALDCLATIRYACIYWIDHLVESGWSPQKNVHLDPNGLAHRFFESKGLYWIESLSLLRSMSKGMRALQRLVQHIQVGLFLLDAAHRANDRQRSHGASGLLDLASDTYRFLHAFGPLIEMQPLQAYASALVFSPTKSLLRELFAHERPCWVKCKTKMAKSWSPNIATLEGHSDYVSSVAISPNGRYIASGSTDCTIKLWDARTGIYKATLEGYDCSVLAVAFSPNSRHLASASDDSTITLWDVRTGKFKATLEGHTDAVNSVCFSPDGQCIATGSDDCTVKLWDAQTLICKATLEGHIHVVWAVAFSPGSQYVASASDDETVRLWDMRTKAYGVTLKGHIARVSSVAFSPDGRYIATGSDDSTIKLWDMRTGNCKATLESHIGWVRSVVFSPDGQRLVSGSDDHIVKIWDAQKDTCEETLVGHNGAVSSVAFSPDGQRILSASGDATVKLWTAKPDPYIPIPPDHNEHITSVTFWPDGRRVVSTSADKTAKLWDTRTGVCTATLYGHTEDIISAALSPNGGRIATASKDCTVKIWDAETYTCEVTLKVKDELPSVAFSPDGRVLAVGTYYHGLLVWDTQRGVLMPTSQEFVDLKWISSVAFSPDGERIVTTSGDDGVSVWNSQTGAHQLTLRDHELEAVAAAFSPNGKYIVSAAVGENGEIKVWDAQTTRCEATYEVGIADLSTVSFDPTSTRIRTDGRVICLDSTILSNSDKSPATIPGELESYHISLDHVWVMKESRPVLWLPHEYSSTCMAITVVDGRAILVIGTPSGRMIFFHLFT